MTITLKRSLGEAGAFINDSENGADTLYDVLNALCTGLSQNVTAYQAVVATGIIASMVVDQDCVLDTLACKLAVCGTLGATTVQLRVNGTAKCTVTIDNADADGTYEISAAAGFAVEAGDLVDINVSAAPTGGTGLSATGRLRPVTVE
jgi:hypothetical protein